MLVRRVLRPIFEAVVKLWLKHQKNILQIYITSTKLEKLIYGEHHSALISRGKNPTNSLNVLFS